MKVIQILHHSLTPFKPDSDPRQYEEDWHVKVAKQLKRRYEGITVECWRPEHTLDDEFIREDEEIIYRIFPSKFIHFKLEYSPEMIDAIRKNVKENDVILHFHGLYTFSTYLMVSQAKYLSPVIVQSHGGSPAIEQFKEGPLPTKLSSILEFVPQRWSFRYVDHFLTLTSHEASLLSDYAPATVSPMGVDFNRYQPIEEETARKQLQVDFDEYIISYLGRLADHKGVDILIEAAYQLTQNGNDFRLLIGGSGSEYDKLVDLTERLGISERVSFLGHISDDDKIAFYNASDIVCFPSKSEPYGIVPVEALACRTPVVATKVGAVTDIADHFGGGVLLARPDDTESLTTELQRAIDGELATKDINREQGRRHHSWDAIIDRTVDIYADFLRD